MMTLVMVVAVKANRSVIAHITIFCLFVQYFLFVCLLWFCHAALIYLTCLEILFLWVKT